MAFQCARLPQASTTAMQKMLWRSRQGAPPWAPMRKLCFFPLVMVGLACLSSCVGPAGRSPGGARGGSSGASEYGDRPGPSGFRTVILDAGHGGKDSGAVSNGLVEKQLALEMTRRIGAELGSEFRVIYSRPQDVFVELDDRVAFTNRQRSDAVLLSLHFNHGPSHVAGPETYWWRTDSYALAKRIQQRLQGTCPVQHGNLGLKRRRLRLTRNPVYPCVLVECGYLSSGAEAAQIRQPAYRARLARAIADAIRQQSAEGDRGMGPLPAPVYAPPSRPGDAP
jgi:N-acetylmuramoyl-L-alanine amidase